MSRERRGKWCLKAVSLSGDSTVTTFEGPMWRSTENDGWEFWLNGRTRTVFDSTRCVGETLKIEPLPFTQGNVIRLNDLIFVRTVLSQWVAINGDSYPLIDEDVQNWLDDGAAQWLVPGERS